MKITGVEILDEGRATRVTWNDGHSARFHALWLRDNALDPKTRSSGNGQRLITVLDISPLTTIGSVAVAPNGDLSITFAPEGHETVFPAQMAARADL